MSNDVAKTVVREEAVLEKFEGEIDDPSKVLLERITLVDGAITKHEFFQDGELVETIEGGNNGTNNSI